MATAPNPEPVASVVDENREAVGRAWRLSYSAFLARAVLLCHGDRDRAEELVSKATLRILDFVATHDQPLREVRAYYFLVLRNLAIDEFRAARRSTSLYDRSVDVHSESDAWCLPVSGADADDALAARRALGDVRSLLEQLPDESRDLFVQRFIEERSYGEIAPALGVSEALARKRVQKLREWLARRVAPWAGAETITDHPPARLSSGARLKQGNAPHAG
jgi:RNA polymerase sigma-70 factor (ECF subfamily)